VLVRVFGCQRADVAVAIGVGGGRSKKRSVLLVDFSGFGKKCEIIGRFHVSWFLAMTLRWKVKRGDGVWVRPWDDGESGRA